MHALVETFFLPTKCSYGTKNISIFHFKFTIDLHDFTLLHFPSPLVERGWGEVIFSNHVQIISVQTTRTFGTQKISPIIFLPILCSYGTKSISNYHSSFHHLKVVAIRNILYPLNLVNSANPDSDNYPLSILNYFRFPRNMATGFS
jgi:hypothetical protein